MTTLLEYLLAKYLGTPISRGAPGSSYWNCPKCGSESFRTFPDKPGYKHRAKCWSASCGFRGDAADMLKHFHPAEDYTTRLLRLEKLQRLFAESTAFSLAGSNERRQGETGRGNRLAR